MALSEPDRVTDVALTKVFGASDVSLAQAGCGYAPSEDVVRAILLSLERTRDKPVMCLATEETRRRLGVAFERMTRVTKVPVAVIMEGDLDGLDLKNRAKVQEFLESKLGFSGAFQAQLPEGYPYPYQTMFFDAVGKWNYKSSVNFKLSNPDGSLLTSIIYVKSQFCSYEQDIASAFSLPEAKVEGPFPANEEMILHILNHEIAHTYNDSELFCDEFSAVDYFRRHPFQGRASKSSGPHLKRVMRVARGLMDGRLPSSHEESVGIALPGDTQAAIKGADRWINSTLLLRRAVDRKLGLSTEIPDYKFKGYLNNVETGTWEALISGNESASLTEDQRADAENLLMMIHNAWPVDVMARVVGPKSIVRQMIMETNNGAGRKANPVKTLKAVRAVLAEGILRDEGAVRMASLFVDGMEGYFPTLAGVKTPAVRSAQIFSLGLRSLVRTLTP